MQIKILTKEESDALVASMYKERMEWTTEEMIADAKFMKGMPDMGNTKYIIGEENWNKFFEWLTTSEAKEQWTLYTQTLPLARYFNWKYCEGLTDEEINELIKNQIG